MYVLIKIVCRHTSAYTIVRNSQFNQMFMVVTTAVPVKIASRKYSKPTCCDSTDDQAMNRLFFYNILNTTLHLFLYGLNFDICVIWRCFSSFSPTIIPLSFTVRCVHRFFLWYGLERKIELFATIATFCRTPLFRCVEKV